MFASYVLFRLSFLLCFIQFSTSLLIRLGLLVEGNNEVYPLPQTIEPPSPDLLQHSQYYSRIVVEPNVEALTNPVSTLPITSASIYSSKSLGQEDRRMIDHFSSHRIKTAERIDDVYKRSVDIGAKVKIEPDLLVLNISNISLLSSFSEVSDKHQRHEDIQHALENLTIIVQVKQLLLYNGTLANFVKCTKFPADVKALSLGKNDVVIKIFHSDSGVIVYHETYTVDVIELNEAIQIPVNATQNRFLNYIRALSKPESRKYSAGLLIGATGLLVGYVGYALRQKRTLQVHRSSIKPFLPPLLSSSVSLQSNPQMHLSYQNQLRQFNMLQPTSVFDNELPLYDAQELKNPSVEPRVNFDTATVQYQSDDGNIIPVQPQTSKQIDTQPQQAIRWDTHSSHSISSPLSKNLISRGSSYKNVKIGGIAALTLGSLAISALALMKIEPSYLNFPRHSFSHHMSPGPAHHVDEFSQVNNKWWPFYPWKPQMSASSTKRKNSKNNQSFLFGREVVKRIIAKYNELRR